MSAPWTEAVRSACWRLCSLSCAVRSVFLSSQSIPKVGYLPLGCERHYLQASRNSGAAGERMGPLSSGRL